MRISLLYNERAGDGMPVQTLRETLERHGHEVVHLIEKDAEFRLIEGDPTDLVVAAGGDGTVRRAAEALCGRKIPLAIIPAGTANNIAKSLEIAGSVEDVIRSWESSVPKPLDVGIVRGPWGERQFIEAVGSGLIPAGIAAMEAQPKHKDEEIEEELRRAVQTFADTLRTLKPQSCRVTIDSVEIERDLLLVQVLNMRAVGPNLILAPDIDPGDGLFSVVLAGDEHRQELLDYLHRRLEGADTPMQSLPRWLAQRVEVQGPTVLHVDDDVRDDAGAETISMEIQSGAITVLTPEAASPAPG